MAFLATRVQGDGSIDYTPTSDVAAGDVLDCGTWVAVAEVPIPANTQGAMAIEGTFDFLKSTSEAIAFGVPVTWNATAHQATASGAYDANIGLCVRAALAADTVVRVLLVPGM